MKKSELLRAAKAHLWDGTHKNRWMPGQEGVLQKTPFICTAIAWCVKADEAKWTGQQVGEIQQLIRDRLFPHVTFTEWYLSKGGTSPRGALEDTNEARQRRQGRRLAWMDTLIEELEAKERKEASHEADA